MRPGTDFWKNWWDESAKRSTSDYVLNRGTDLRLSDLERRAELTARVDRARAGADGRHYLDEALAIFERSLKGMTPDKARHWTLTGSQVEAVANMMRIVEPLPEGVQDAWRDGRHTPDPASLGLAPRPATGWLATSSCWRTSVATPNDALRPMRPDQRVDD